MSAFGSVVQSDPDAVVAIDFGTSRTGFAYAFPSRDGSVPDVFNKVYPEDGYHKQPTCIYVNMDTRTRLAVGHKAQEMAACDLMSGTDFSNRHMFTYFKRGLEGDAPSGNSKWTSIDSGVLVDDFEVLSVSAEMPALTLITMTLNHVKTEALEYIKSHDGISLNANSVRWVVTIPAIWSEPAKLLMKEAACGAGMVRGASSSSILLALEPEAAILGATRELASLLPELKSKTVMVADCGGGTVDICALVLDSTNPLKCHHAVMSTGGWWGATTVDDELENFLHALLGPKLFRSYKAAAVQRMAMLGAWESYKKTFNSTTELVFDCRLDFLDEDAFEDTNLKELVSAFSDDTFGPVRELTARSYMVKIPISFVKVFFDVALTKIIQISHL